MIKIETAKLSDDQLDELAIAWFQLCRTSPDLHWSTPLGTFLFDLASEVANAADDRRAAIDSMEVDLGEVGEIVEGGQL